MPLGHAGLGGEVRGGDAGGGGADRDVAVPPVGVGERGERGRLAGAGVADDADNALRARRGGVHHRELLAGRASAARSRATCSTVAGETVGTRDPPAVRGELQRYPLVAEQLGGRERGRPPDRRGRDRRDLLHRRGSARPGRAPARPGRPGRAPAPRP